MRALLIMTLCLSFSTSGLTAADEKDDSSAKELKQLEGTWRVLKTNSRGKDSKEVAPEVADVLVIEGKKMTLTMGSFKDKKGKPIVQESTLVIDPSKEPKWIDVTRMKAKISTKGIYELSGDKLKIALPITTNGTRPTEFKSRSDGKDLVLFYERVKP
jgi:uncharacterized protein (TIGR03067 family)